MEGNEFLNKFKEKFINKKESNTSNTNNIVNEPRLSVKDILKLNEDRIKNLKEERDKYNERNSIYEKNRATWKLKMKKLSEFIKTEKEEGQTNEEFFNENEDYLKDFGITNVNDFESVQNMIDNSNDNFDEEKHRNSCFFPSNPYKNQLKVINEEFDKKKSNDLIQENDFISFNKSNNVKTYNLTNQIVKGIDDNIKESVSYIGKPKKANYETSHIENDYISKKSKKNKYTNLNTNMQINNNNFNIEKIPKVNKFNEEYLSKEEFNPIYISNTKNPKLLFRKCESNVEINYSPIKKINEIQNEISIDIDKAYSKNLNFKIENNQSEKIEFIANQPLKRYPSENISIENPSFIKLNSISKIPKYEISYQNNESLIRNKDPKYSNNDLTICQNVNKIQYDNIPKNKKLVIKKQVSQGNIKGKTKFQNTISKEITDLSYNSEIKINNNKKDLIVSNEGANSVYGTLNLQDVHISNDDNQEIKYKAKVLPNKVTSHKYDDINYNNINDSNNINNNNNITNNNNINNNVAIQKVLESKEIKNKYQKNIITSLDNITIMKYQINDSAIPLDPSFLDVLCINCYECIKFEDMDLHSQKCVIKLSGFKDNAYDEDYNTRIFKLHESLKSKKNEIENNKDKELVNFYNRLVKIIYQILINNNSIEELDSSISEINKMTKNDIEKGNFTQNYKFYFLLFCQRISQLVYMKLKDMEKLMISINHNSSKDSIDSLDEEYNINNKLEDDEHIKYMKEQLTSIEDKTNKAKKELKQWKKEAKLLENTLRRPQVQRNEQLSDIASDINSKNENYDILTTFTGQMSDFGDENINDEDFDNFNEDDQKKYFLSIGLGIKFKYSEQIEEDVSIADLFEKAKNKGIKPQNYHDFLIRELNINE